MRTDVPDSCELNWYLCLEAAYILKERNEIDLQEALRNKMKKESGLLLWIINKVITDDPKDRLLVALAGKSTPELNKWLIERIECESTPVRLSPIDKVLLKPEPLAICFLECRWIYQKLLIAIS